MRNGEKTPKQRSYLIYILLIICIFAFCYAGYRVLDIVLEYHQGSKTYHAVSQNYVFRGENSGEKEINYTALQEDYPMATCWIYIKGTPVDYPVAQWEDNSYYLDHLLNGTRNNYGTIFIDYRNNKNLTDRNTFIYGHHMKDGSMFASLVKYKDQSYYESHPQVHLITPEKKYVGEIFSAYVCGDDSDTFTLKYKTDKDFEKYLKKIQKRSVIDTNVEVSAEDRIVTLMTCTYEYDDARFVVHAKLVEAE